MKWLVQHTAGAFLVNENNEIERFEPPLKDLNEAVNNALLIEGWQGKGSVVGPVGLATWTRRLLEELKKEGFKDTLVFETDLESRLASEMGFDVKVEPANEKARFVREKISNIVVDYGIFDTKEEFYEWLHRVTIEVVRRKLRSVAEKRDQLAIHAVRTIDDIDKITNLLMARLREWYSLHFPELDDLIKDHETYAKIVRTFGNRDNITLEGLLEMGLSEELAKRILEAAKRSTGADLTERDIEELVKLASIIDNMYSLRRDLTEYIDYIMRDVAPNVSALVGPVLGARLLSLAGSLEQLAKMPASTIQVLGAEKALFRALRTGGKPPKHGVIFQYPEIHRSPKWQRGKIARALASKLAIAARTDYFTGRDISDKLREELRERIEEIKRVYAKPPKREAKEEKKAPPARRPPRKGGARRKFKKGGKGRKRK
ncbi:C/D box methylation guide ribonucleoprotein complex aNOP56 subunit [Ignicoccus islandicus DSM 13165]|uniref:C/D box methylation guide ribonucleoprotein complex aNOP56 subunit n=1 Tax=Ignicoccus islandicus DSM 13165 TaxID=940295 RepID=A0A0U2M9H3_9CREN|nr:C/D box methylation guide ribonucleoprotein complex aNOP56 subunit [Ignicoccus islandicus]ALU11661.1 C/D box methylation guide ribonucleoprotein complex aNOP56 subunit [Ignicoccus islandicus DSM 13165]